MASLSPSFADRRQSNNTPTSPTHSISSTSQLPPTSLLARTGSASFTSLNALNSPQGSHASSFGSTSQLPAPSPGASSAIGSHARNFLESILPPLRRVGLQRTASSMSTSYKPQKPSSLASSASVAGSDGMVDDDSDTEDESEKDMDDGDAEDSRETTHPGHALSSASSTSSTSLRATKPVNALSTSTSPPFGGLNSSSGNDSGSILDHAGVILALLDDEFMDEEDKIDRVRLRFSDWLEEAEGVKPQPFRLDGLVLDLMHRHREDVTPTGASFPSSPLRRPGSARSFSSQNLHRPWTPTKGPLSANATSVGLSPSSVNADFKDATPPASPAANLAPTAPQGIGSSAHLGGVPAPPRTSSPGPMTDPGIIGSGSPRGSPRLWNRAPAPLSLATGSSTGASSHRDSLDSTAAAVGSPWGGFGAIGSNPSTPSGLSSGFSFHAPSSPLASAPPGLSNLSAQASTAASTTSLAGGSSRPASPSPFNSPRLNVAAIAFKPRTASSSSSHASAVSSLRPSLATDAGSSSRRSSSQAILAKNYPVGDDDEDDEFSPFASARDADKDSGMLGATSSSTAGSFYGSSAGSSFGEAAGAMAAAAGGSGINADDATGLVGNGVDMDDGGGMTPFDVLYSILSGAGGSVAAQWAPEQIEEALANHNWDVDAVLATIFDAGGRPPPSNAAARSFSGATGPRSSPRLGHQAPAGPAGWAANAAGAAGGRAGVSLMSREAFSSHRGGRWGRGGGTLGSPGPGRAGTAAPMMSPSLSSGGGAGAGTGAGAGGAAGPGRVCRYFLSGDCRRADCRFSHDLSKALCKFWLRGQCLNDPCPFLHDQDVVQALASGMATSSMQSQTPMEQQSQVQRSSSPAPAAHSSSHSNSGAGGGAGGGDDFPELPPSGPKAQRAKMSALAAGGPPAGAPTGPASSDPNRTRWVSALQRNPTATPLGQIQQGDASMIHMHSRNAPVAPRPPLGPRSGSSTSNLAMANKSAASSSRIALRAPTLLPTLAIGKYAAQSYSSHRSSLTALIEQRNRCLARASEAFKSGDGASARKWSQEGQVLNAQITERGPQLARDMLKERHKELQTRLKMPTGADGGGWGSSGNASDEAGARGLRGKAVGNGLGVCLGVARKDALPAQSAQLNLEERTECLLDAHGLHASEAVEIIEEFLLALEKGSNIASSGGGGEKEGQGQQTAPMRGLTYLAVGLGRHTSTSTDRRRVGLAQAVKSFLAAWGYPYAEMDGVLVVDHLTHF